MGEEIVLMRAANDLSPNPVLIPCLASKVTWAEDRLGLVLAEHPVLPPTEPQRVGVPVGSGGRTSAVPEPQYVYR